MLLAGSSLGCHVLLPACPRTARDPALLINAQVLLHKMQSLEDQFLASVAAAFEWMWLGVCAHFFGLV